MLTESQNTWLRFGLARLRERSTWNGLIALAAGVTGLTFDVNVDHILVVVSSILAPLNIVWPDVIPDEGEEVDDPWADASKD